MQYFDYIVQHRRNLHKIPELGFCEYKTQRYVIDNIKDFVDYYSTMASTGVVGYLNNNSAITVLLRADMDGLPITEENDVDYRSTHDGVMHACGHDAHMAILLGLIKYFYDNREKLKVNLKYMFQPGEEGMGGAKRMIEEGILEGVNFAFALHVWNELEVGKIALGWGPVMASSDSFEVEIIGKGAHAATPQMANDPIITSTCFINYVYTNFPRFFNDYILSFTYINAGSATNIIPQRAFLRGTVRTFNEDNRKKLAVEFERSLRQICDLNNTRYVLRYIFGYPVLINDKKLYDLGFRVASELVGIENVVNFRSFGSEDMAFVMQRVAGLYVAIGSGIGYPHHSPKFDINEKSLLIGFEFMRNLVLSLGVI